MGQGYFLFFIVTGTALFLILSAAVVLLGLLMQRKRFLHEQETLKIRDTFERERLIAGLEARDRALQEMGEVIHDSVNQDLLLVSMTLGSVKGNEKADELKLSEQIARISSVIHHLRDLSHILNPARVEAEGLNGALREECVRLNATGRLKATLSGYAPAWVSQSGRTIILYRMCQEIIQNAVKHSGATSIHFQLEEKPGAFLLSVTDDGKGFEMASIQHGNGILSLKSRAEVIGAKLIIRSSPGAGATFTISFTSSVK